jgi:hypothetical protein
VEEETKDNVARQHANDLTENVVSYVSVDDSVTLNVFAENELLKQLRTKLTHEAPNSTVNASPSVLNENSTATNPTHMNPSFDGGEVAANLAAFDEYMNILLQNKPNTNESVALLPSALAQVPPPHACASALQHECRCSSWTATAKNT